MISLKPIVFFNIKDSEICKKYVRWPYPLNNIVDNNEIHNICECAEMIVQIVCETQISIGYRSKKLL